MKISLVPKAILKLGIVGIFLFGLVVAGASFALFGCYCYNSYNPSLQPENPVETAPVAPVPASDTPKTVIF